MLSGHRSKWVLPFIFVLMVRVACAQNFSPAMLEPIQSAAANGSNQFAAESTATPKAPIPPPPIAVPAGTHVMIVLVSPLHTTSGIEGSGIYAETLYPVIYDNRVVIPARSQVQGVVEGNQRPGHLQRKAEFKFRFTNLIFPNNHVAAIDGILADVPGSRDTRSRGDGTVRTVDQTEKVIIPAAAGAVGGAILGSVSRVGIGKFVGAGLGAGLGAGGVLLHRGDEISLSKGTYLEMVIQSPLALDGEQASFNAHYVPANAGETRISDQNEARREEPRTKLRQPRPNMRLSAWPRPRFP